MRIEAGKYYVDGEGFYHCLGEYPDRIHLRMEMATISKPIGLYIALACCCETVARGEWWSAARSSTRRREI